MRITISIQVGEKKMKDFLLKQMYPRVCVSTRHRLKKLSAHQIAYRVFQQKQLNM
jgi:hypothetical protein